MPLAARQPKQQREPEPLQLMVATRPIMSRLPPPECKEHRAEEMGSLIESLPPIPAEEFAGEPAPPTGAMARAMQAAPVEPLAPHLAEDLPAATPPPSRAFAIEEFDADAELAANTTADDVLAFFPAEKELSDQFRPRVQEAFTLARNGALHAARARFEQLLFELAQAKDASQMTSRHSRSLATGLRALEEADDFVAVGGHRDVNAVSLAAGHQTPMLHEVDSKWTLPHEAIAMYHLYAQQKLAASVAGERAGSMMLFGVGKIYAQLAERDNLPQATRKSLTMYRSAVTAHGENHLAANEAGVLLARGGRYAPAATLLEQAARQGGASTTHRNLAYVHAKMDHPQIAQQHSVLADRIARGEVARGQLSAERGIAWVSPEEFNRRGRGESPQVVASRPLPPAAERQRLPPPALPPTAPASPSTESTPTLWW